MQLGALALERDVADEIVDRIGQVGAFRRAGALGNEKEALEAHRVIDAQHAGVTHVGAVDRAQRRPALTRAGQRIGRRQAPVLALDGKRIGRRPDGDAARKRSSVRPGFGAVRRGPDREIAVEPDLEAAFARALGRPPKLAIGEPLAKEGELERCAVALDRLVDRLGLAVAQILRPEPPILAGLSVGGRLEGGEAPQRLAARSRERMIVGDERIAWLRRAQAGERRAPGFERDPLGSPHGLVRDIFGRRSRGELGRQRRQRGAQRLVARQAGVVERVDQDRVEEAAIRGVIGARPLPVAGKQHVQRAQAEVSRPSAAGLFARARERRKIADSLIPTVLARRDAKRRPGRRRQSVCAKPLWD